MNRLASRCGPSGQSCNVRGGRSGFTLIELLCVILLIGVLAGAMALLLRETLETERLLTEGFDSLLKTSALADDFRTDVAAAAAAPAEWQGNQAGPRTLILKMPAGGHVVYSQQEDGWQRRAVDDGKVAVRSLPISASDVEVEFLRAAANPRLISLRLHRLFRASPVPGQTLEIAAALGGDTR